MRGEEPLRLYAEFAAGGDQQILKRVRYQEHLPRKFVYN